MNFRDNLLHLRQQRNMTQEQLAMLLDVSRQSVAKWEAGQSTPELDRLMRLADLFGCTLDELVSGDLSTCEVAPAEVLPDSAVPEDVCGYDAHVRDFSLRVATGTSTIIAGVSVAMLLSAVLAERVADAVAPAAIVAFAAGGLWFILPAAIGHASFAREHPFVEDFHTPEERMAEGRCFARDLTVGIVLILAGVVAMPLAELGGGERLEDVAGALLMAFVAAGTWFLVRGGIVHGMSDLAAYNRERADEQWERDNPHVGRICGIIMLVATALGLLLLFGGMAAADASLPYAATLLSYFWVVWPIGGIACAIVTLILRNASER